MNIKILEQNDNINEYMECIQDLNNAKIPLSSIEEIKHSIEYRPKNILTFILENEDKHILATATVIIEKKLRYKMLCCHIEDVAVHPNHRNKGYGKKIVEFCINLAEHNGCYKVKLNCSDNVCEFYSKLGFESHGHHMYMIGENKDE